MKFDSSALSIRSLLESQMLLRTGGLEGSKSSNKGLGIEPWGIPCKIFNLFNLTIERRLSKSWLSEMSVN